jgi:hypothetical protein
MWVLKRCGSVVGTIFRILVIFVFLYLLISLWYFALRSLTFIGSTSTTKDDLSLTQLSTLSFDNANTSSILLSAHFWDMVLIASGKTVAEIVPNTVYGFIQSSNYWKDLVQSHMDNPPSWTSSGPVRYSDGIIQNLSARVMGAGHAEAAARVMDNYTASVAGLSLAGVDFLTFNGASSLNQYIQTGNIFEAMLMTLPGQIYDLFSMAADPSYPEQFRAQLFGEALAITGITIVTAGKDGFSPKFESMLSKMNLLHAWPKIKASLADIGAKSSPAEAYAATEVLQQLANKFPTASVDDVAFAADRIDLLVQSLKDNGFAPNEIQERMTGLVQATSDSNDVGDLAEAADEVDYGATGTIMVVLGDDRVMSLYDKNAQGHNIRAKFLQDKVPGFVSGQTQAFKITIHKDDRLLQSYHVYNGGKTFGPAIPEEQGSPGDVVAVSFELLSQDSFVKSIPSFELTNDGNAKWVADQVVLRDFTLTGNTLAMNVLQNSPFDNVGEFAVTGTVENYPGSSLQFGGVFLQFRFVDYIGRVTEMRLQYDGFSKPNLLILKGGAFQTAGLVSFDSFRLSVVYGSDYQVATVYIEPPSSEIYRLAGMTPYSGNYLDKVSGRYSAAFQIENIAMQRDLEKAMLQHGSAYDYGRLGAENAYVIAVEKFGLKNLVIQEPSASGRDLYTQDNSVSIQARLLVNFKPAERISTMQNALLELAKKVQQDYEKQDQMVKGYAILSYVDSDGSLKAIILEVPKQ